MTSTSRGSFLTSLASERARVDGVMVPMKQTVKVKSKAGEWQTAQVLNYESVTFNDVDPSVFIPPDSVRKLFDK